MLTVPGEKNRLYHIGFSRGIFIYKTYMLRYIFIIYSLECVYNKRRFIGLAYMIRAGNFTSGCLCTRAAEFWIQEAGHLSILKSRPESLDVPWRGAIIESLLRGPKSLLSADGSPGRCPHSEMKRACQPAHCLPWTSFSPRASVHWRVWSTFRGALFPSGSVPCVSPLWKSPLLTQTYRCVLLVLGVSQKQLSWQPRPVITGNEMQLNLQISGIKMDRWQKANQYYLPEHEMLSWHLLV